MGSILFALIVIFGIFAVTHNYTALLPIISSESKSDQIDIEYNENIDSVATQFPYIEDIQAVYWKEDIVGNGRGIGPTDYWIKAFVIVDSTYIDKIIADYEWENKSPVFSGEIEPKITKIEKVTWSYNADFSEKVLDVSYIGEVYIDLNNHLIYINAMTH